MPVFFQHQINDHTRLGIWKIEESEEFFKAHVPVHREVTHPRKRLQHLAGRFLLPFLFPDFPHRLIRIADTKKPFLAGEQYHFSISHCGDYAAAIVSRDKRVGIDIEIPAEKIEMIRWKFLKEQEWALFQLAESMDPDYRLLTLLWSCKEAVFKWYGGGEVDFRKHIQLQAIDPDNQRISCFFAKNNTPLTLDYHLFDQLVLSWVVS